MTLGGILWELVRSKEARASITDREKALIVSVLTGLMIVLLLHRVMPALWNIDLLMVIIMTFTFLAGAALGPIVLLIVTRNEVTFKREKGRFFPKVIVKFEGDEVQPAEDEASE